MQAEKSSPLIALKKDKGGLCFNYSESGGEIGTMMPARAPRL